MTFGSIAIGSFGLAVFRIIVGAVFVSHAIPKIEDPESTHEFFNSVGLPDSIFLVYLALGIETVAGTLLALGLFTRASALVLTLFMGVATYVALYRMDKDFAGGYEVDLLLLGASFMFYLAGPGMYALDYVMH